MLLMSVTYLYVLTIRTKTSQISHQNVLLDINAYKKMVFVDITMTIKKVLTRISMNS